MLKLALLSLLFILAVQSKFIISISGCQDNGLIYKVTNAGDLPKQFLTYGTPLVGNVFNPFVYVTLNGVSIKYIGPVARLVFPPPPSAYITIPSKASISIPVKLEEYYKILTEDTYKITLANLVDYNESILQESSIVADEVELTLTPAVKQTLLAANTNCDATENSQIASATTTGTTQARNSKNCLAANSCNALVTRWFGGNTYYNYVSTTFNNIYNSILGGINAYCNPAGCGANVYAYVYPNDPAKTVYLCGAFWSQPLERANTLVHELSHFTVIGGTQDYTYGITSCLALARSNSNQASHNADNICYFSDEA